MEELKVLQSKLKAQLPDLELREQEPMRLHTTFRVGGPASLMALPRREADLGQRPDGAGVCPWDSRDHGRRCLYERRCLRGGDVPSR